MIGLNGSLSIAENALSAQYAGLAVTNNNIANANTPGYSRQVVDLSSVAYDQNGTSVDGGVAYSGYTSVRDSVLNMAINARTSEQSSLDVQNSALTAVNSAFSGTTTGIGASLSSLFSTLSALSTSPSDGSARQAVLNAAGQLVNDFHQASSSLSGSATSADRQVSGTVSQINQIAQSIAELNAQLQQTTALGQDGGAIQDQRDQLTSQLAKLTGISLTANGTNPTITTAAGSPLVIGSTSYSLQAGTGADGKTHVFDSQGQDITAKITGGSLGGALTLRDSTVPGLSSQLDALASQFASAMNAAQASGYDASGNPGAPLFSVPASGSSAQGISLALTSGSSIAASSSATSAGSGNLSAMLAVQTAALPFGATPTDTYAGLVQSVGAAGSSVSSQLNAATASLSQLTTQRDSQSAVSIDQESINLVRYQQAYTAAAKVIATINSLYSTVMNMTQVTG